MVASTRPVHLHHQYYSVILARVSTPQSEQVKCELTKIRSETNRKQDTTTAEIHYKASAKNRRMALVLYENVFSRIM